MSVAAGHKFAANTIYLDLQTKDKIKKDIDPQMSQMNADEKEERVIFSFLAHLRSFATSADTLSFLLLFLAQPRSETDRCPHDGRVMGIARAQAIWAIDPISTRASFFTRPVCTQ
jgi:hypothetical protein